MRKIILMIAGISIFSTMVMGCSRNITKTEGELINKANSLIEEKYDVEINKDDYTYEVGEVINDDKFVDIQDGKTPEIVFIRAVNKEKPSSDKVYDFSIKFNTKTNEVITSECGIY